MSIEIAKLLVTVGADISSAEKGLDGFSAKVDKFSDKLGKTGGLLTAGVTTPIVALGTMAVMAASSLEESMNKVRVVFGESSDAVMEFTSNAASALGMSQQQALEATGTFGNLFSSMGMGQEETLKMSTSLVKLATDLASFNNIDPTVALDKLRAGISGEAEPLKTLGVNLTETAVQEKALAMGLAKTSEELTMQQKVLARYAIILEQTKNSQGDFANTAGGLANQIRTVKGNLSDMAASLGSVLIPYVISAVKKVNELIQSFLGLGDAQRRSIVVMLGIAAAAGPVLIVLSKLIPMLITASGAVLAFGSNLTLAMTAFQKGLSVTTALKIGFGALAPAILTIIGVVAAAAAAWVFYEKVVKKVNEANRRIVEVNIGGYLASIVPGTKNAIAVMNEYIAASAKVREEDEKRSAWDRGWTSHSAAMRTMQEQNKKLGTSLAQLGRSYNDYINTARDAMIQQTLLNVSQMNVISAYQKFGGSALEMVRILGILTPEEYATARATINLSTAGSRYNQVVSSSEVSLYMFTKAQQAQARMAQESTAANLEAAIAVEQFAQAILQFSLSGEVQATYDEYLATLSELTTEESALSAQIEKDSRIWGKGSTHMKDLNTALANNKTAQEDAAKALAETTKQIVFQQAAAGLDAQATLTLARTMGVLSETDYAVASLLQSLKTQFAGVGGEMDPAEAQNYANAANLVYDALMNIQTAGGTVDLSSLTAEFTNLFVPPPQSIGEVLFPPGSFSQTETAVSGFATNVTNSFDGIPEEARTASLNTVDAFAKPDWSVVGISMIDGIVKGLESNTQLLIAAAEASARAALAAAMAEIDSGSPSRKFMQVGKFAMQGMAAGIMENTRLPVAASARMAAMATRAANSTSTTSYSTSVAVNANVNSEIDMRLMAMEIAREIREGNL